MILPSHYFTCSGFYFTMWYRVMGGTCVQQRVKFALLSEIALKTMHSSLSFLFSTAKLQVTALIYNMKIFVSLASWVDRVGWTQISQQSCSQLMFPSTVSSSEQHYRWKSASLLPVSTPTCMAQVMWQCTRHQCQWQDVPESAPGWASEACHSSAVLREGWMPRCEPV